MQGSHLGNASLLFRIYGAVIGAMGFRLDLTPQEEPVHPLTGEEKQFLCPDSSDCVFTNRKVHRILRTPSYGTQGEIGKVGYIRRLQWALAESSASTGIPVSRPG